MAGFDSIGWMYGAGSLIQAYGIYASGKAARTAGDIARQNAEFEALQAEELAGQAVATSQRAAEEERRQARLAASRSLAVAAASGGGVSDPTVVNLIASAHGEGAYRAGVAMYEGETKARKLRMEAIINRGAGAEAQAVGIGREEGATLAALGTIYQGAATLYSRYGMGGPRGDAALVKEKKPPPWTGL